MQKSALEHQLFIGNSKMARLMRETDWGNTAMGPVEEWPQSLKTSLQIILNSSYPMFIWWGPQLTMFHNDAYLPVLGKKHPDALGKKASTMWAEIWEEVGTMAERVLKGENFFKEDLQLYLARHGFTEETYWTFSYSPIFQLDGKVGGLFCACNEGTRKILQQRRLSILNDISAIPTRNTTVDTLFHNAIQILKKNPEDIPFAAIYLVDESTQKANWHSGFGLGAASHILEKDIALNEPDPSGWDLTKVRQELEIDLRKGLLKEFPEELAKALLEVDQAAIIPITRAGESKLAAILICGISPYLEFDHDYFNFLKLLSTHISRTKADIRSHEIAIERARALAKADKANTIYTENLRQSQARLEAMITQAPIAMAILRGEDLFFEIANQWYLELVNKSESELLHKPLLKALPELKGQPIEGVLKSVYQTGETFTAHEFPVEINLTGIPETVYFTFVYEPMRDFNGEVAGIMVVATDVTAQYKARQLVEKREQYFRNMANNVPMMIWLLDETGSCTYVNQQWLDYTGQQLQEALGFGWLDAVHPEDRPQAEKIFKKALHNHEGFELTYRLKDARGGYYWHIDKGMPRFGSDGSLEGFTGGVLYIHDRKMAEDALRQSENELRSAITATNLGTWVYYPPSGKINWSVRSKELFGLGPDAFVDYNVFLSALHPDDRERIAIAVEHAIDPDLRAPYDIEYRSIGLEDKKLRWLRATGQPYFNEQGVAEVFIGTLLDITQNKAMEKQKDDFLAIASHELKTPVTSIKGYVQMIAEDFEDRREYDAVNQLEIVDRQVDKLIVLINELLDAGKIESGEIKMNKIIFDFDELLQEVVTTMQYIAGNHRLIVSGKAGRSMLGDRHRLEQVFQNLISNAIKFSPGADQVNIQVTTENGHVRVSVQDYGVGIKPENSKKIFDRFYRDSDTSQWSTGLGLGLFISSEIVKRHKGTIYVDSRPQEGSKFHVSIPFQYNQ